MRRLIANPDRGPHGGTLISVADHRSLDAQTFTLLVRDRWIGSRGDATETVRNLLGVLPSRERSPLVIAVEGRLQAGRGPASLVEDRLKDDLEACPLWRDRQQQLQAHTAERRRVQSGVLVPGRHGPGLSLLAGRVSPRPMVRKSLSSSAILLRGDSRRAA